MAVTGQFADMTDMGHCANRHDKNGNGSKDKAHRTAPPSLHCDRLATTGDMHPRGTVPDTPPDSSGLVPGLGRPPPKSFQPLRGFDSGALSMAGT
ncbi:MAG: hypothetical protein DHS20C03_32780 [Minwuia thermotolerans]|nr:MAG: hypothetical protein DHS20C03_32780 [Minwuia thermotolerans]